MKTINVYLLSKSIHRLLMLLSTALLMAMAGTGIAMKYPVFFNKYLAFIDLGIVRFIHNQLSVIFTIAFLLMAMSGLVMYFYPIYARRRGRGTPTNPDQG